VLVVEGFPAVPADGLPAAPLAPEVAPPEAEFAPPPPAEPMGLPPASSEEQDHARAAPMTTSHAAGRRFDVEVMN
jgi:hypothetical protein